MFRMSILTLAILTASSATAEVIIFTDRTDFLAEAGAVSSFGFADIAPESGTVTLTPTIFLNGVSFSSTDTRAAAASFFPTPDPVLFVNDFGSLGQFSFAPSNVFGVLMAAGRNGATVQLELFDEDGLIATIAQPLNGYLSPFSFIGIRSDQPFIAFRVTPPAGSFMLFSELLIQKPGADPGVIPEPATWTLLIAGFGLVGSSLRRRRIDRAISA
jgi:hypothetical protein